MKPNGTFSRRDFVKQSSAAVVVAAGAHSSLALTAEAGAPRGALIPTARGDAIDASKLGVVLPTELIIQQSPELTNDWPEKTWGGRPEAERIAGVVAILNRVHAAGVGTIIDRTIPGIGRDVRRMKKIALQTKLNIIVTTGYYTLRDLPYYFRYREHFPESFPKGEVRLDDLFVQDIQKGILDTGVHAAAIKVVSDTFGITPDVLKVFQATCRAHRRTGAPIVTHGVGVTDALLHQKIFVDEGVDLARVVLAHQDRTPPDVPLGEFERLLGKGSYLSFDGWGPGGTNLVSANNPSREQNLERVAALVRKGFTKQLLLSVGNVAFADVFPPNFFGEGGAKPYTGLFTDVIPGLKSLGVSDSDITVMTRNNPQQMLSTLGKGGY